MTLTKPYKQNASMVVLEGRLSKINKGPDYKIEEDKIRLLNGPYSGKYVHELWETDSDARDYIYKQLYRKGDEKIKEIIKRLFS